MSTVLRYRYPRHLIPNPNLAFIRHFVDTIEKTKDAAAVASEILQSAHSELNSNEGKLSEDPHEVAQQIVTEYPEEPTTCCMSGCANCVWLDYAEKIRAYYQDGGERAIKEINERVSDPNMKAFLMHELRTAAKGS